MNFFGLNRFGELVGEWNRIIFQVNNVINSGPGLNETLQFQNEGQQPSNYLDTVPWPVSSISEFLDWSDCRLELGKIRQCARYSWNKMTQKNDISRPRFAYGHLLVVSKCKSHHVRVWICDEAHLISVRRARIKDISFAAYAYRVRAHFC